jgi:hypothetical protein
LILRARQIDGHRQRNLIHERRIDAHAVGRSVPGVFEGVVRHILIAVIRPWGGPAGVRKIQRPGSNVYARRRQLRQVDRLARITAS